jgi:hypothetical protein
LRLAHGHLRERGIHQAYQVKYDHHTRKGFWMDVQRSRASWKFGDLWQMIYLWSSDEIEIRLMKNHQPGGDDWRIHAEFYDEELALFVWEALTSKVSSKV